MLPIKIQATIEVLEPCKFEGGEKNPIKQKCLQEFVCWRKKFKKENGEGERERKRGRTVPAQKESLICVL